MDEINHVPSNLVADDISGVGRRIRTAHLDDASLIDTDTKAAGVGAIKSADARNRGNPPYVRVRHYFFDMGNDSLLAFFEIPKGSEPAGNRNAIGAMQHCAFVVTAERFRQVEARLKSRAIDYIGPIPQAPGLLGIYFYDPNGIRLEFACQPDDGEAPGVIACITQTKAEARAELATLPGVAPEWIAERLTALPV